MRITKIVVYKIELPMITTFTTGFGTIKNKPSVIVEIKTNDGLIGYGEAAALQFPIYNPESVDIVCLVIKKYLSSLILNRSFSNIQQYVDLTKSIKGNQIAKAGLETAVWSVFSLKKEKSIANLLGGKRKHIEIGESIGIKNSISQTLEEIDLRLTQGFKRIKIKIKPGWDLKLVEAIRNKFGDIPLMVDANSSYTLKDLAHLKKLDNYNLMMIEQPLAENDIIDHSILQKALKTAICLDESILSCDDARKAIYLKACRVINIKPGRVGGLLESKKIHDYCQRYKIGVWCGGMLEYGVGRAANAAISSLSNFIYPADMSPVSFYYQDDIVKDSLMVKNGLITVPKNLGLGTVIDKKKLKKYTKEKILIC